MCRLCDDDRQVTGTTAPARNDLVDLAQDAVAFLAQAAGRRPDPLPNKRAGRPGAAVVAPSWAAIGGRALRGHEQTKAAGLMGSGHDSRETRIAPRTGAEQRADREGLFLGLLVTHRKLEAECDV